MIKKLQPISGTTTLYINSIAAAIAKFIDALLNRIFSLSHNAAKTRFRILLVAFFLMWILLVVNTVSLETLRKLTGDILTPLLNSDAPGLLNAITTAIFYTFLNLVVLRHLIILVAPFWLMQRIGAAYLADIFEKEEPVARKFIRQAAFGTKYNTIRIREGKIVEADQASPIVQIGGPGYIVVELDSAVLFERPDGSEHIIAPTIGKGSEVVSGFERIRATIDLRDVIDGQSLTPRSREGIPVTAKDIQYSYSIYRGPEPVKKDLHTPYPFDKSAVLNLVYKGARPVKPGEAPSNKPEWSTPLPGKIAGPVGNDVSGFVGKRGLSQFLSNIGSPEQDKIASREEKIDKEGQRLSERNGAGPSTSAVAPADGFTARTELTASLYENFKKRAPEKGLALNWIGVGTWDTPAEIIPAKHMEAWKLSRENYARGNQDELNRLRNDAKLQELLRLVQAMPINKFYDDLDKASNEEMIDVLLKDYLERLKSARELFRRDQKDIPEELSRAIEIISNFFNPNSHRVGG